MSGILQRLRARPHWGIDVVIAAVIAFLVVMAVKTSRMPLYVTATEAEQQVIARDIDVMRASVIGYARTHRRFPKAPIDLVPTFLPSVPRDPYGREYVFVDGGRELIWIFCLGSDGELKRYPPDIGTPISMSEARENPQ